MNDNNEKCIQCDGEGRVTYNEDGRTVTDDCYHCGATGKVDSETVHHDHLMSVARNLAYNHVMNMKRARNEDPEGEGWAFCAAENMLSESDYTRSMVEDFAYKFAENLGTLPHDIQVVLVETLTEKKH